jgi:hypothetical protein
MDLKKYDGTYKSSIKLYEDFFREFIKFINDKLASLDEMLRIINLLSNKKIDLVRCYIEDRVSYWRYQVNQSIEEGVSDKVYNTAFRTWREIEDVYMVFYDNYVDLKSEGK